MAQSTTCPKNLISIEATPVALEVPLCGPQNPTKTKPSKFKRKQKEQETEETLLEQNPEIRDFLLKHIGPVLLLHSFRICTEYF